MDDFETKHLRQWLKRAIWHEERDAIEAEITAYLNGMDAEDRARVLDHSWREILDMAGNARDAASYWAQKRATV